MKYKEHYKNKIESAVEIAYRKENKIFWLGGEHYLYVTQKEFDKYIKKIPEKKKRFEAKLKSYLEEKERCDAILFDGS